MSRSYQLRQADRRYKKLLAFSREQGISRGVTALVWCAGLFIPVVVAFSVSPYMGFAMVSTIAIGVLSKKL